MRENVPKAEAIYGESDAGLQKSMLGDIPEKEVRIAGKGKITQAKLDDFAKLQAYQKSNKAELAETKEEIEALESDLKENKAAPLTDLITTKGKMKGELHHLTKAQYKKLMGRPARPSIVVKGVIPWNYALDELATERGFKSDEQLKEAIEKASDDKTKLENLKAQKRELKKKVKTEIDKPEVSKSDDTFNSPVFPKDQKTKSVIVSLGDTEVLSKRNPSFYQVEIDYKSTPQMPDHTYRVRYSKDAKTLTNASIKDEKKRLIVQEIKIRKPRSQGYKFKEVKSRYKSGEIETSRSGRGHIKL